MTKTYWHFCREDMRLGYGDGRQIKIGETITVEGDIELCRHGLHASKKLIDALQYAPGPILCKVELGGNVINGADKVVASERTVVAYADCTDVLREFARKCALDVIHLWDAPEVVESYLTTGDESLRAAARGAARVAAGDAAWVAARVAARDAAWDAAWVAARDAAVGAAWDAARGKQSRRLLAMISKADWVKK